MDFSFKDKPHKNEPWVIIYRRLKRYCNNPKSYMYRYYGARGAKCRFTSSLEIKYLWDRDNAQNMENPQFVTKNNSKIYSVKNCCFMSWLDYWDQLSERINKKLKIKEEFKLKQEQEKEIKRQQKIKDREQRETNKLSFKNQNLKEGN